jgi:hypothetical protein
MSLIKSCCLIRRFERRSAIDEGVRSFIRFNDSKLNIRPRGACGEHQNRCRWKKKRIGKPNEVKDDCHLAFEPSEVEQFIELRDEIIKQLAKPNEIEIASSLPKRNIEGEKVGCIHPRVTRSLSDCIAFKSPTPQTINRNW